MSELSPSAIGPEPGLATPSTRSRAHVTLRFQDERGTWWRVYDFVRVDRRPALVPPGSLRASHRGFVIIGKYPEARRYAFRPTDGPEAHELDPYQLGMQLYLAERVKRRRRSPAVSR